MKVRELIQSLEAYEREHEVEEVYILCQVTDENSIPLLESILDVQEMSLARKEGELVCFVVVADVETTENPLEDEI